MSDALKSGNFQHRGLAHLNRLRVLRDAYQRGFFTAPTTLPLPEVVADGHGPDDWLGDSREGAPSTERRGWPFRVAPDLQGRPFCPNCGVLHDSFNDLCPVCERS